MKTKNTNQQSKSPTNNKNNNCAANRNRAVPFYITMVSITAIFALLLIFVLEKNETLKCVKNGLVQKVDNGKIVWTKP